MRDTRIKGRNDKTRKMTESEADRRIIFMAGAGRCKSVPKATGVRDKGNKNSQLDAAHVPWPSNYEYSRETSASVPLALIHRVYEQYRRLLGEGSWFMHDGAPLRFLPKNILKRQFRKSMGSTGCYSKLIAYAARVNNATDLSDLADLPKKIPPANSNLVGRLVAKTRTFEFEARRDAATTPIIDVAGVLSIRCHNRHRGYYT